VVTDTVRSKAADIGLPEPAELVFLQYTSGSTGRPRGIRITHDNLAHNLEYIRERCGLHERMSYCQWLPQYHDLGLIAGIFGTLWTGGSLTMLSPLDFLKRPALWGETIHRFGATHTATPNFALDLLVRKTSVAQRAEWDFSTLEAVGCGGEPVMPGTVERFESAFATSGLRPGLVSGCYGLAEHVAAVAICGRRRLRVDAGALREAGVLESAVDGADARVLISNGPVNTTMQVRIVSPEDQRLLGDGEIGEIWVDSRSKADGYEGSQTADSTFGGRLGSDEARYLQTGDLGAIVDGELYVTGRIKELIIVRGHNLYPTDLEEAVRMAHPAIRPGRIAALGVRSSEGTEEVVLFIEVREGTKADRLAEVAAAARTALAVEVPGMAQARVVLGSSGLVPKTTSGKVQRTRCVQAYLQPDFGARSDVLFIEERAAVEAAGDSAVMALVARVLGRRVLADDLERSPAEIGLDSAQLMELQSGFEELTGAEVSQEAVLTASTLQDLIDGALGRERAGPAAPVVAHHLVWERYEPSARQSAPRPLREWVVPEGARDIGEVLEQGRALARASARSDVVVITSGAVSVERGERPDPIHAAVWGFVRAARRERRGPSWRLRDVRDAGGSRLPVDPAPELALRRSGVYSPRVVALPAAPPREEPPFGGLARLRGPWGPQTRRAALWLVQHRGAERIIWDVPAADGADGFVDALRRMGVEVERDCARTADVWFLVAAHSTTAPAARQTRGRVSAALRDGLLAFEEVLDASADARVVVLSDAAGWFGPVGRSAWAASLAALEARARALYIDGRQILHASFGPRAGEVPQREVAQVWKPEGIALLSAGDKLPQLEQVFCGGRVASAGFWATNTRTD